MLSQADSEHLVRSTSLLTQLIRFCSVVSAPGKVLLTGAYLVLGRPNPGLILSTSARFYAIIAPLHHPSLENVSFSLPFLQNSCVQGPALSF
jgi:hypothetical protein